MTHLSAVWSLFPPGTLTPTSYCLPRLWRKKQRSHPTICHLQPWEAGFPAPKPPFYSATGLMEPRPPAPGSRLWVLWVVVDSVWLPQLASQRERPSRRLGASLKDPGLSSLGLTRLLSPLSPVSLCPPPCPVCPRDCCLTHPLNLTPVSPWCVSHHPLSLP